MRISFVVPAYNEAAYISKCLDAIMRETKGRDDCEVIVVDNGSNDGTDAVVARYQDIKLIREPRRGANRARQTGFEASHGELVAFLDSDTEIPQGWTSRVEQEFAKDKDLVCLSGPFIYYDLPAAARVLVKMFYGISYAVYVFNNFILRKTSVIQGGTEVVRSNALKMAGGHNVALPFYGDDADLAMRLRKIGEVRFSFAFAIPSSGRRLAKEGVFTMGLRYGLNYFWIMLFNRPFTVKAEDVQFVGSDKDSAYRPEHALKEWSTAVGVVAVILFIAAAIVYLIVKMIR
jgi:glycosyltransferase involved in cell wall biosynthesis